MGLRVSLGLIAAPPAGSQTQGAHLFEMSSSHWYLVSSHGSVLFFVAANPDCMVDDIKDGMSLTRRTVWGIIGDLRRAGMLRVRRSGRHHHYSVDLDGPFLHPTMEGVRLRSVLGGMANGLRDQRNGPTRERL